MPLLLFAAVIALQQFVMLLYKLSILAQAFYTYINLSIYNTDYAKVYLNEIILAAALSVEFTI